MKQAEPRDIRALYQAIVSLKSVEECKRFLGDLLTENELAEFAERWQAARMLAAGESYQAIEERTGLSSRTIARVARWVKEGNGGYRLMLKRIDEA
ncbi:MAG: helix-turn-helix domain-containing protein [Bacteroidetes bacterium]|nr:helix-turn-helix domain-containing protein [Bacteroidota bacterium]